MMCRFICLVIACCQAAGLQAALAAAPRAAPVGDQTPTMDGLLDEPLWQQADTLTGFTSPGDHRPVDDQTEVRFAHSPTHLFMAATVHVTDPSRLMPLGSTPFSRDSLELFIQPQVDGGFYQIAVSYDGLVFAARNLGEHWQPSLQAATSRFDGGWRLELAVPWAELGLQPQGSVKQVVFNITRNDWASSKRRSPNQALYSSYAMLPQADFRVPDWWGPLDLPDVLDEPRQVVNQPAQPNLFSNDNFALDANRDGVPDDWSIPPQYLADRTVERSETSAYSNHWVIRARRPAYPFLRREVQLEAGKPYTVRVVARAAQGKPRLGIIQIRAGVSDTHILWDHALTGEFRPCYATFTARADVKAIQLYVLGDEGDGLEVESVQLYEGQISPLAIRPHVRTGLGRAVPGTAQAIPPNMFGNRFAGGSIRALFVCYKLFTAREVAEVIAGLEVDADLLMTTAVGSDTYYTTGSVDRVQEALRQGRYDVYVIGRAAEPNIGPELRQVLLQNIKRGATLLTTGPAASWGAAPQPVEAEHYLANGVPTLLFPGAPPVQGVEQGAWGSGRIVAIKLARAGWDVALRLSDDSLYATTTFPVASYARAAWARWLHDASGHMTARIKSIQRQGGRLRVSLSSLETAADLRLHIQDKHGQIVWRHQLALPPQATEASVELPELRLHGHHAVAAWLLNPQGAVYDFHAATIERHADAYFGEVATEQPWYTGDEPAQVIVGMQTQSPQASRRIAWALQDVHGRTLERGQQQVDAGASVQRIAIPIDAVRSNLCYVWLDLVHDDAVIDRARCNLYVPDRDRAGVLDDFGVAVWPEGNTDPDAAADINAALQTLGVNVKAYSWHDLTLASGMATATNIMAHTSTYVNAGTGSVRQPCLRDPRTRQAIQQRAQAKALEDRRYGPAWAAIVDEPDDVGYSGAKAAEICTHPACLAEYRHRLAERFGSIDRLNAAFDTTHASFDEVSIVTTEQARQRTNHGEFLTHRRYRVDTWLEALRLTTAAYAQANPGVPLSLQNSFGHRAISGNDYHRLLTEIGLGFGNEYMEHRDDPIRGVDHYYRSFAADRRNWGFIGYAFDANMARFLPWWFALNRFGGVSFYDTAGEEAGGFSWGVLTVPEFAISQRGALLRDGVAPLRAGLGKVFLDYEYAPRQVALLYSQESMELAWALGSETGKFDIDSRSPYGRFHRARQALQRALDDMLFQFDYVAPAQLSQGRLTTYKVMIVSGARALSDQTVEALREFANAGGTIITDADCGSYDDSGRQRRIAAAAQWAGTDKFPLKQRLVAEVGQGRIIFYPSGFSADQAAWRPQLWQDLLSAEAMPVVRSSGGHSLGGWEARHFRHGSMNVFGFVRDHRRGDDSTPLEIQFQQPGHLYDFKKGQYLGYAGQMTLTLAPGDGTAIGHYPHQILGLSVQAPSRIKAGEDLVAELAVQLHSGQVGHHVLRVQLAQPDGREVDWLSRNLSAPGGRATWKIRLAYDDPVGTWQLRVRDLMSGITQQQAIELHH